MTIKKITVLGGAGFVGSCLVTKLDAAGYQVKVLTRRRESAKHLILLPNVEVCECDVNDNHALKTSLTACDAVINLIGILHEDSRHSFESMHHQLPRRIAQLCEELSIQRLLHMSALQASKNSPSLYLRSKATGEEAVSEFSKKLNLTIFKPSVIFGRDDHFFNMFVGLIRFLPIIVLAKPNAKFQPVWVDDVAQCFLNAIQNTATYGKSYELGGPNIYTLRELMQKVMAILGKHRPIIGLNDTLSMLQGLMMELSPFRLLTRDNIRAMQVDNICSAPTATELGVTPAALEVVAPTYLQNTGSRVAYDGYRSAAGRAIQAKR